MDNDNVKTVLRFLEALSTSNAEMADEGLGKIHQVDEYILQCPR